MKAMVFAAGRGTRLRPLTDALPKALVEVGGRTLLEHVLRRLVAAGVTEAILNLHHFGEQIPPFLEAHRNFGLQRVAYSEEPELLDTGGGLKRAAAFFAGGGPFLVHNVDVLSDFDLAAMVGRHQRSGALATLACKARPTSRPLLFDGRDRLVGRRGQGCRVEIARPGEGQIAALGFCGIHVLSPGILAAFTEEGAFPIIDAYLRLAVAGEPILAFRQDGARWRDCGRPEDLRPLEQD